MSLRQMGLEILAKARLSVMSNDADALDPTTAAMARIESTRISPVIVSYTIATDVARLCAAGDGWLGSALRSTTGVAGRGRYSHGSTGGGRRV